MKALMAMQVRPRSSISVHGQSLQGAPSHSSADAQCCGEFTADLRSLTTRCSQSQPYQHQPGVLPTKFFRCCFFLNQHISSSPCQPGSSSAPPRSQIPCSHSFFSPGPRNVFWQNVPISWLQWVLGQEEGDIKVLPLKLFHCTENNSRFIGQEKEHKREQESVA